MVLVVGSNEPLEDVDRSFKLSAGPADLPDANVRMLL
jgi:hypothetical protein